MNIKYFGIILLIFNLFFSNNINCFAQSAQIDSLKQALKNLPVRNPVSKFDTVRTNLLAILAEIADDGEWELFTKQLKSDVEEKLKLISSSDPLYLFYQKRLANAIYSEAYDHMNHGESAKALECFLKCSNIQKKLKNHSGLATTLNSIGQLYKNQGDLERAINYYEQGLKLREEIKDKVGIAQSYNNIGDLFKDKGDIAKALDYFDRSLKMREQIGDKYKTANSLNTIGLIFKDQGEAEKALEYFLKALNLWKEVGAKNGMAYAYNNIGIIYDDREDLVKALEYYQKSLELQEELNNKKGISISLNNLASVYQKQGDLNHALDCYLKSLKLAEELSNKQNMTSYLINIGKIYFKQKKYALAEEYGIKSIILCKELKLTRNIGEGADLLYKTYRATGKHQKALVNYELYIQMRDSVNNESTRKASIKSHLKYEYEKQSTADSVAHAKESEIKNAEIAKQTAEIKAKRNQQYALFGGLGLVMIFAGFMYNRFKVTQKQKGIIEEQKEVVEEQKKLVEEKQKEILDSIHYAKRIQLAQIPSEKRVFNMLNKLKSN